MVYEVPQFIKEETKLIGLITFTQLWILLSFGGIILLLFFALKSWLWLVLSAILAPVGFSLAFGKMHSVPIYTLAMAAIRHFWLPKYYLWQKERTLLETSHSVPEKPKGKIKIETKKELDKKTLKQLTDILDK
ncbi:MAG TPA: hypothetical protein VMV95_01545 [Bacillota bacterium]|nr:hypothetical protein [Bacillota bacterium]